MSKAWIDEASLCLWFESLVNQKAYALRNCPFCKTTGPEINLGMFGHHTVTIQCKECGTVGPYSDLYTDDGYVRKLEDEVEEDRRIVKANFENSVRCWNGSKYKTAKAIRDAKGKKIPTYEVFRKNIVDLTRRRAKAYILKHFDLSIEHHATVLCSFLGRWICDELNIYNSDFLRASIDEDRIHDSYVIYIGCNFNNSELFDTNAVEIKLSKEVRDQFNFRMVVLGEVERMFMFMKELARNNENVFNFLSKWNPPR